MPLARKVIDFGGMNTACASCHRDQHKAEYGRACDAWHRPATFKASGFVHPRSPEFFAGQHAGVACVRCHVRSTDSPVAHAASVAAAAASSIRAVTPSMVCATCHVDVHLGQLGPTCDRCHMIDALKFAPARFSHERGAFPLVGKHKSTECAKCHPNETRAFPVRTGTAKRFMPMSGNCQSCHQDPHLGQTIAPCQTCHTPVAFRIFVYPHRGLEEFFAGFHGTLACRSCHKSETGQFPAGQGTAIKLKVGRTCRSCHPQF